MLFPRARRIVIEARGFEDPHRALLEPRGGAFVDALLLVDPRPAAVESRELLPHGLELAQQSGDLVEVRGIHGADAEAPEQLAGLLDGGEPTSLELRQLTLGLRRGRALLAQPHQLVPLAQQLDVIAVAALARQRLEGGLGLGALGAQLVETPLRFGQHHQRLFALLGAQPLSDLHHHHTATQQQGPGDEEAVREPGESLERHHHDPGHQDRDAEREQEPAGQRAPPALSVDVAQRLAAGGTLAFELRGLGMVGERQLRLAAQELMVALGEAAEAMGEPLQPLGIVALGGQRLAQIEDLVAHSRFIFDAAAQLGCQRDAPIGFGGAAGLERLETGVLALELGPLLRHFP